MSNTRYGWKYPRQTDAGGRFEWNEQLRQWQDGGSTKEEVETMEPMAELQSIKDGKAPETLYRHLGAGQAPRVPISGGQHVAAEGWIQMRLAHSDSLSSYLLFPLDPTDSIDLGARVSDSSKLLRALPPNNELRTHSSNLAEAIKNISLMYIAIYNHSGPGSWEKIEVELDTGAKFNFISPALARQYGLVLRHIPPCVATNGIDQHRVTLDTAVDVEWFDLADPDTSPRQDEFLVGAKEGTNLVFGSKSIAMYNLLINQNQLIRPEMRFDNWDLHQPVESKKADNAGRSMTNNTILQQRAQREQEAREQIAAARAEMHSQTTPIFGCWIWSPEYGRYYRHEIDARGHNVVDEHGQEKVEWNSPST